MLINLEIISKTWQIKKLEKLCDLIRGTEPGSNFYFNEPAKNCIQFIRVGDITGKVDNPKFVSKKLNSLTMVKPDDILISFDGTPGVVTRGWSGAISSGIRAVRNIKRDEILKDFLFYYLQTPPVQEAIRFYTTGVTILHASRAIPHVKIEIPPLPTQQKIVERLDVIKKAQELNEKQIELAEELFQSLLNKELNPKGKNWKVVRLGKVAKIFGGYAFKSSNLVDKKPSDDYLPVMKIANVLKNGNLDVDNIQYHKFNKDLAEFLIKKNNILVAMTGATVGKVASSEYNNLLVNQRVGLIKAEKNVADQKFLQFLLLAEKFYRYCQYTAGGGAQGNISPSQIMKYQIPLPPLETQRKIVGKLSAVQDYKKKLIEQKQKVRELFESCLNKAMKEKSKK